jgi:hypothetical protein
MIVYPSLLRGVRACWDQAFRGNRNNSIMSRMTINWFAVCLPRAELAYSVGLCQEGSRPRANQGWQDDHCASGDYFVP